MENQVIFLNLPGTRIYLRPPEESDLPFFRRVINNEKIARFLMIHDPMLASEEEEWLKNLPKRKETNRVCAIVLKETHEVIGSIGLHNINWTSRTATTGPFIGREDLLGKGLGTEAKMLWLKYAFLTLNLRQILSQAYAFNGRSIKYSQKCGYEIIGKIPNHIFRDGKYHDIVQLLVTRENWEPLWHQFEEKMKGETSE